MRKMQGTPLRMGGVPWLMAVVLVSMVMRAKGQTILLNQCPTKPPLQGSIDSRKIDGTWYEVERSALILELPLKCVSLTVQQFYDNSAKFTLHAYNRILNTTVKANGTIKLDPDFTRTGKLHYTVPSGQRQPLGLDNHTLHVVHTDYAHLLVLWACNDIPSKSPSHSEVLWVWSRAPHAIRDPVRQHRLKLQLQTLGLSHMKLQTSPRINCVSRSKKVRTKGSLLTPPLGTSGPHFYHLGPKH